MKCECWRQENLDGLARCNFLSPIFCCGVRAQDGRKHAVRVVGQVERSEGLALSSPDETSETKYR